MKKMIIRALVALAMFAVSCDKNNTGGEGDVTLTASALVGEWSITCENFSDKWTFTSEKLTRESEWNKTEGTYTVENGTISYTITKGWTRDGNYDESEQKIIFGAWEERDLTDDEKIPIYLQAKLIYGGSVLIFHYLLEDGQTTHYHGDNAYFLFKKGGTIPSDTKPLQGTWCRYEPLEPTYISVRIIFDGNKFELIVAPWSEKYAGTYTYKDGFVTCTITAVYTACNPDVSGHCEKDIDPTTLKGTWYPLPNIEDAYYYINGLVFPFVADGDVAYGLLAYLTFKYHKK